MPERDQPSRARRKPARPATPPRRTSAAARKGSATRGAAASKAAKAATPKKTARKSPARAPRAAPIPEESTPMAKDFEDTEQDPSVASDGGPLAVGGDGPQDALPEETWDAPAAGAGTLPGMPLGGSGPDDPAAPPVIDPLAIERPKDELLVGIACAVLAVTTFFTWYKVGTFRAVSGFASGTWGPVVFFLALAGLAIVVLRRMRVPISFPFDHSLVLEGIGWLGVVAIFLKRFFPPTISGVKAASDKGLFVALFAAVAVALLGGRVSSGSPFVVRPGWFGERAGKLGVGLLAVFLAAGVAFGLTNTADPVSTLGSVSGGESEIRPQNIKETKGMPSCATDADFPLPAGFTATRGQESTLKGQPQFCVIYIETTMTLDNALKAYQKALTAEKWKYQSYPNQNAAASMGLTAPRCGTMAFTAAPADPETNKPKKGTAVTAFFQPCPKPQPSK